MKVLNDLARAIDTRGENVDFGQGLKKVLSEDYALVTEDGTLNRYNGEQRCILYKVGEPLIKVYQGIGLQKSIEAANMFSLIIL